ncbi:putative kinase [Rhodoligotrophos appendicifer]|uniref:AAA family ATPase n=1 Tax=Rhodoligotrophos appendicifer TaxID=987056 RepID=UPI0011858299|nr:AAA family ATPase [Rhodoligotrophos appendicifer]
MPVAPKTFRSPSQPSRQHKRRRYDRVRDQEPSRAWYKTARWQKLRWSILVRDLFTCQKSGCGRVETETSQLVCDHVEPHRGDEALFWNGPFQTLCKACHDRDKQREERLGDRFQPYSIPSGVKPSRIPVHLVCGAPGSGKSTYVRQHAQAADYVIDFDDIRERLGLGRYGGQDLGFAYAERDRMIRSLEHRHHGECWLIVMAPTDAERRAWMRALGRVTVHTIDTDEDECLRRIMADPMRQGYLPPLVAAVAKYFEENRKQFR